MTRKKHNLQATSYKLQPSKGFSLVEIIVAVAVFLIFLTVASGLTVGFWKQTKNAVNKERAIYLAQESLEALRNIRDNNFINLTNGTHGIAVLSNEYSLSGASDVTDIFTRQTTISTINENQKQVSVLVTWADENSPTNSVTLNTYLTNWRKITPLAGLTVNKTVINHGDNKTTFDFAPYNATTTIMSGEPPAPEIVVTPVTLGQAEILPAGDYVISETTNVNYDTTFSGDCDSLGQITLAHNDSKICNILNEEKPSYLTVNKSVINHGGTKAVEDFSLFVDAVPVVSGQTNTFDSGSHTVSETIDPNYSSTISGDCNSSGVVILNSGDNKTCIITNEEVLVYVVPTVNTPISSSITSTSATLGATVQSLGIPASISARGVCYSSLVSDPSLINGATCVAGTLSQTVPEAFTISATSLSSSTLYNYRGYATNTTGTGYTANSTFTTLAPQSTITFVGRATASGTTASIPAHNVGDLLVAFAYRDGSANAPTVPSGWTAINTSGGANANSSSLAYRIATGTEPTSGWSNATHIIVQAYRGQNTISPIGAFNVQGGAGTTVTYPAITSLNVSNGTSWVIGFAGHRSINTNLQNPPTGMTQRSTFVNTTTETAGHDTAGGVSSWSAQSVSVGGTSSGWMTRVLEIKSQ